MKEREHYAKRMAEAAARDASISEEPPADPPEGDLDQKQRELLERIAERLADRPSPDESE